MAEQAQEPDLPVVPPRSFANAWKHALDAVNVRHEDRCDKQGWPKQELRVGAFKRLVVWKPGHVSTWFYRALVLMALTPKPERASQYHPSYERSRTACTYS